jgi:general secretion pathway protein D
MKRQLLRLIAAIAPALVLAACASDPSYREGERLLAEGKDAAGLASLEKAVAEHPGNAQYRTGLIRAREALLQKGLAEADALDHAGKLEEAAATYRELALRYGDDDRVVSGLNALQVRLDNRALLKQAAAALAKNEPEAARARLRAVLAREPGNPEALRLLKQVDEKAGSAPGVEIPQLGAAYRRPVSLEFRDAPLKQVFDALSRQSGLNFVFDKDVKLDQRTTVFARDTAIADALDALLATSQLAKKILSANTVLIYPNQPNKVKDYQEQVVRSFFLAHAEAKNVMTLLRGMARIKDVNVDEKLNMVAVRDTPEVVRLAEKLVKMADRPDAEVMLDVEILEVTRSRLQDLGIQYPNQLSVLNVVPNTSVVAGAVGAPVSTTTTVQSTLPLTLNQILFNNLKNSSNISVSPTPTVNLRKDVSDVNLLANPRIRVMSGEKAKIHVGDKVPVITSNTTSTGVVSESVSYLDVGLKLDVEPQVGLDGDVKIKIGMEVSNIVNQVKSSTGTLTYQLGSRNANTVLRLKDGETQVLAGLISDADRAGASKVPGLGDLPILGRLFSSNSKQLDKTEIILTITPHILRNVERPDLADAEFSAGTDNRTSDQPLRLRNAIPTTVQGTDAASELTLPEAAIEQVALPPPQPAPPIRPAPPFQPPPPPRMQ